MKSVLSVFTSSGILSSADISALKGAAIPSTTASFKEAGIMPLQRLGNEVPTEEDIAEEDIAAEISLGLS